MTFRDACLQLGIAEDKLCNDDNDAKDILYSNNSNRADEDNVEIFEENTTDGKTRTMRIR